MMKRAAPPSRLPKEFGEVWHYLKQADDEASSRQALAAELGISTHTLQRILVRGDVPSFRGNENRRIVHAWARTLARLARRFDRDPREWIRRVGIPWSDDIARIASAAVRSPAARPRDRREPLPETVRVALVDRPPFSSALSGYDASFIETLIRRWIAAWDPKIDIRTQTLSEGEALQGLTGEDPRVDLVAGLCATAARMRAGIAFVPIPGLRIEAGGICLRHLGDRGKPSPKLVDVFGAGEDGSLFLVAEDEPAHTFLAGACGIPSGRIVRRSVKSPVELAAAFLEIAERESERRIVLLAETGTCSRTAEVLQHSERLGYREVVRLDGGNGAVPSWPLSIAIRSDATTWREALIAARDLELYGSAADATARLYSALPIRPGAFEPAMPRFEKALAAYVPAPVPGDIRHCRSCSASLLEAHNIGPSRSYCRWCSDETGRLRPRADVEKVLARWIQHWQGGLPDDEALRRTRLYMQAMPAWSDN